MGKANHVPSYKIIYQTMKQRIMEGYYPLGSFLPTEAELEGEFSVSRTTIRRVTSMLAAGGYIRSRQGIGSEVLDVFTTQRLNRLTSVTETLTSKGFKVSSAGMCIEHVQAPVKIAKALELPEGGMVYRLQRIQCADGTPIAIMNNYFKDSLVPGLDQFVGSFVGLYQFLEQKYNLVLKDAMEYLTASVADPLEAQVLHIPVGAPLLCSRRISNDSQGPVEYSITKLVADKYEYSVYLQGR